MATEHRMIEPFESSQIRYANGNKIVSYGTSSYGYDIRWTPRMSTHTHL